MSTYLVAGNKHLPIVVVVFVLVLLKTGLLSKFANDVADVPFCAFDDCKLLLLPVPLNISALSKSATKPAGPLILLILLLWFLFTSGLVLCAFWTTPFDLTDFGSGISCADDDDDDDGGLVLLRIASGLPSPGSK